MAIEAEGRVRAVAPIVLLGLLLAGCASHPKVGSYSGYPAGDGIGTYRVGRPYEIKGVWYYPAVDYNYNKTGVASWYGEQFEGRLTANGEIFDLNRLTAANTTLPMPSIVQVTNLENGRSLQLRVNDRGPFVGDRLIDVSRRAAQMLGFERQGTALVRVKVLKDESIAAAEEAMHNSGQILVADAGAAAAVPAPPPPYSAPAAPLRAVRRAPAPPQETAPIAARSSPPPQVALAPQEPVPSRIAMMPSEPPPPQIPPEPPPRQTYASRFALISPAEAAPLPPAQAPAPKPEILARATRVPQMPPSSPSSAAAPSGAAGHIFIQAGAFSVRDNAQRVQSHIARLGSVAVSAASINGVEMYRVRLGPFDSAEQADRLLARVVDSGYPQARIVSD